MTKEFHYYGMVRNEKTAQCILLGPIISTVPTPAAIRSIMREHAIPQEYRERLTELFQFLPTFSFHQFCHFLSLFYQELFDDVIDIDACLGLLPSDENTSIAARHSVQSYDAKEMEAFHNTYHYEQMLLEYIRNGNGEGLKEFFPMNFLCRRDGLPTIPCGSPKTF